MMATKTYLTLILVIVCLEKRSKFDVRPRTRATAELDPRWLHQCTINKNMADDKVFLSSDSTSSPQFIQELLPSAERTALLYHLSYLCLGGFPKLEHLIRKRALETQLLFGSSEALLMKCVGTSENLITSLLPSLKVAVEKNKPQLALKFLEKAKGWISDIITDVEKIVKRYDKHNSDVAASISDFSKEKEETKTTQKQQQQQQTIEMEALQKIIDVLEANLHKTSKKIEEYEKKIEKKNLEIQTFIISITNAMKEKMKQTHMRGFDIYSIIVPFAESIISYIFKMISSTPEEVHLRDLRADLSELTEAEQHLKEQEWNFQNQLMENQLKLAKLKLENGQMPSVTLLDEVQTSLSRIQQNLVQLQKFWEKVGSLLDRLKKKTFAGEIWVEDLTDLKEEFLESIDAAKEEWTKFGISCMKANLILSIQANQAYRFLEINPSSLSKEQWQKEYESVKQKLENINPNTVNPAAITL